ncbi:Hypothetical protein FKW44_008536, partial [Caligus rogercresseyi]
KDLDPRVPLNIFMSESVLGATTLMKELPNVSSPPLIIEEEDETGKYNDWNHATPSTPIREI